MPFQVGERVLWKSGKGEYHAGRITAVDGTGSGSPTIPFNIRIDGRDADNHTTFDRIAHMAEPQIQDFLSRFAALKAMEEDAESLRAELNTRFLEGME